MWYDLHMEPPATTSSRCSLTSTEEVNSLQEQNDKGKADEHNDKGPDFSLDNPSLKTDATIEDPLHVFPALPNLLSSQRTVEVNLRMENEKRKRQKTEHSAIESSIYGCDASEDTFSSKTSAPPPFQYLSTESVMRQSCVETNSCQGENEEKEQNMLKKVAENSNRVCDTQELSCDGNSAVANAEYFAKESVLDGVKLNKEKGINDNSSNPEEKSDSVKNVSLVKKHDDCPAVYPFSNKFLHFKAYTRRKIVNTNNEENSCYMSPENCYKEPTMQDHDKDDSHKFSDEPLMVGLMGRETKLSRDDVPSQSGAAAEEITLMTEDTSEQRFTAMSSVVDIPVVQLEETNVRQLDHTEITRSDLCYAADLSLDSGEDGHSKISQFSLGRTITTSSKNKLLVLDVNGLLADIVSNDRRRYKEPDFWLRSRKVYKRPFCDDFLEFCFDRFHVGIWSSRAKDNVDSVIQFLMGKYASKLLFCWNESQCTTTKFSTVENINKPLVLKELRKLWEMEEPGLPWEKGEFNESNTLLLDDSPYKALVNPKHTGIFPYSYHSYDTSDSSLGPGGDLRVYLEGLAMAENVQEYVSSNPFGQRPIREANPSWGYYSKVIAAVKRD